MVVYKVDRLTRSLADFAKLVELFDQQACLLRLGYPVVQHDDSAWAGSPSMCCCPSPSSSARSSASGYGTRSPPPSARACGSAARCRSATGSPTRSSSWSRRKPTAVRTIFTRYLELGSIGALIEDLDRRGVRTRTSRLVDGRVRGGIRFGTGALAHLLKNRFYIGEVVYRGAIHEGGHQPIIERELFEAVQARLAENAVGRRARLEARRPF